MLPTGYEPAMGFGGSASNIVARAGGVASAAAVANTKPPTPDPVTPPPINFKNVPGTGPRPSALSVKKMNVGKGTASTPPAQVRAKVAPGQGSLKKVAARTNGVLDALRPTLGVL